ncbi:MAG: hypothetical protein K8R39_02255 [Arcobacteraceae bacterium]|nr:hypothetical protein [Arcobacteraceae bacterium]
MQNTFWTLIEDGYYRIHNGNLKYAPICSETSRILTDEEEKVQIISPEKLQKVNDSLGVSFLVEDFV